MKKVLLTGVALMAFAAASFAQNTTSYTGTGAGQTSTQNQLGNGLQSTVKQGSSYSSDQGNSSLTDQKGKDNSAKVSQDLGSKNNRAGVTQTGGSATVGGGNGNTATITQETSSGGTATRTGVFGKDATAGEGNWAGILQGQQSNKSTISQSNGSSSNFGEIYQTGSNNGQGAASGFSGGLPITTAAPSPALKTAIVQDNNSVGNAALIKQAGNNGGAVVNQSNGSSQNEATVDQQAGGDGNKAAVSQDGTGGNSALNTAKVTQSGNFGEANIVQSKNSFDNQATISQNESNVPGSSSTAEIEQFNNAYGNIATISQTGLYEAAAIYQRDNSHDNTATINQTGTYATLFNAYAEINQVTEVANTEATINQAGTDNRATVTQTYAYNMAGGTARGAASGGNTVLVNQNQTSTGDNNIVKVLQGGDVSVGGGSGNITAGSKVTIDQANSHNSAYLQQTGQSLTAKVSQDGNYNLLAKEPSSPASNALQLGSNYTLSVTQSAPGAISGASNSAFVNSNNIGGGGITINQTLTNN
ncbi:hypothetical protein J2I47_19910 [Fibrella sp. HMF5335]|uniref:Curlin associated repeat-containing protein n=1 Tax=Fibrella rubiginis TaxID=2817060 RepID=A0A939K6H1_9BACT|nr:hypothetical protein [Fibrella rubiginis]MBO0938828.1 hypothetical protein [Fibrella rubiginis]